MSIFLVDYEIFVFVSNKKNFSTTSPYLNSKFEQYVPKLVIIIDYNTIINLCSIIKNLIKSSRYVKKVWKEMYTFEVTFLKLSSQISMLIFNSVTSCKMFSPVTYIQFIIFKIIYTNAFVGFNQYECTITTYERRRGGGKGQFILLILIIFQ